MLIFNQQLQNVEYSLRACKYTLLQKDEIKELVKDPKVFSLKILQSESSSIPAVFWGYGSFYSPDQKNSGFIFIDIEKRVWILDPTTWYLAPIPNNILVKSIKSFDEDHLTTTR